MSSSSEFGLTDEQIVYELASFLHSNILDILGYGVYTSIYFIAVYLILSRQTERPRIGSVVLVTIMWILVTIHAILRWARLDNICIRHGETRETQLKALLFSSFDEFFLQYVADAAVTFISLLLADITMIWRCWALYGRRWHIIMIPGLSLVAGSVCYVWRAILLFTPHDVRISDQITNLNLAFLSATVLTNLFCTTAIVYRPIRVSGWRKAAKTYHRIVEILIESSVLYTAIYVIRIGLQIYTQYFTKELDERLLFPQALGYSITGIAPTLIITCVAVSQTPTRHAKTPTRTSNLPPMKSTIQYFAESQTQRDQPATVTTRTVEDVDPERSWFQDDSDGHAGDYSRSAGLAASGERNTGRVTEVPV